MSTNYPASLDTTTELPEAATLAAQDLDDFPHSAAHGNVNDAVRAIETELGTAPSGASATVKARIDAIETSSWVTATRIATDAVTAAKIAADAVGSSEIAASAVGSSELGTNAVTTTKITDAAVTLAKLADSGTGGSLDSGNIHYFKIIGFVFVFGNTDSGADIATLPAGYRPDANYNFGVEVFSGAGSYVTIQTDGTIDVSGVGSQTNRWTAFFPAA